MAFLFLFLFFFFFLRSPETSREIYHQKVIKVQYLRQFHPCLRSREGLSSKGRSLALALDFFESLASNVESSTPHQLTIHQNFCLSEVRDRLRSLQPVATFASCR